MRTEEGPRQGDPGATSDEKLTSIVPRTADVPRVHRPGKFSPWGELYGDLLAAERHYCGYTPEQHRANVERRARHAVDLLGTAHEANQKRRERVLRYPDLAERIQDVLRLSQASRWNGYVPPRTVAEPACRACQRDRRMPCPREHAVAANTSPIRAELVAIAAEAKRREDNEGQ